MYRNDIIASKGCDIVSENSFLLDIPHIKQPDGSFRCGAVCLEMLLDYLGMHVDQEIIWRSVSAKVDTPSPDCRINKMVLFARSRGLDAVAVSALFPLKIVEACLPLGIFPIVRYRSAAYREGWHFSLAVGFSDAGIHLNDPLDDAAVGKNKIVDRQTLQMRMNPFSSQQTSPPRMVVLIAPPGQKIDRLPVQMHVDGNRCTEYETVFSCISQFNPAVLCAKHDRFIASTVPQAPLSRPRPR